MVISDSIDGDFLLHTGQAAAIEEVERRQDTPRKSVSIPMLARVVSVSGSTEFDIVCIDMTRKGMAFSSRISLAPKKMLAVKMPIRNAVGRFVLCRLCHCTPNADGRYVVGVEFVDAVSLTRNCQIPSKWFNYNQSNVR